MMTGDNPDFITEILPLISPLPCAPFLLAIARLSLVRVPTSHHQVVLPSTRYAIRSTGIGMVRFKLGFRGIR